MILVTGAKGQLGSDVCRCLENRKKEYISCTREELDISEKEETEKFFNCHNGITAVIDCAAYTAVDKAEEEKETCFKINALGTKNLAEQCAKRDIKLMYISTDYVFDGSGDVPFETDSNTSPLNVYGESKLLGENEVLSRCKKFFIVRTSWVYGEKNTNFVYTMLKISKTHSEVNVVCDQIGSPTYSFDLAQLLCDMIETDKYGIYHATNEGYCSWAEFAKETFALSSKAVNVKEVKSEDYNAKAVRPLNSRLSKRSLDKAGCFERLPHWRDALKRYLANIGEIK